MNWIDGRSDDVEIDEAVGADHGRPSYRSPYDLAIGAAFLFVGISGANHLLSPEDSFTGLQWLINVAATLLFLLVVGTSFSLFALLLVAAVISYPLAWFAMFFFYWLGGGQNIWEYWIVTFLICGGGAFAWWLEIRAVKRALRWAELPTWIPCAAASVMLLLAATVASTGPGPSPEAEASGPIPPGVQSGTGGPTTETTARLFLDAWRDKDVTMARAVAHPGTADRVLAFSYPPEAHLAGCGPDASGVVRCYVKTSGGPLVLSFSQSSNGRYLVQGLQRTSSENISPTPQTPASDPTVVDDAIERHLDPPGFRHDGSELSIHPRGPLATNRGHEDTDSATERHHPGRRLHPGAHRERTATG